MKTSVTVTLENDEVLCVGYFTKGRSATYLDPEESADFEIDQVMYNGVDIAPILSDAVIIKLSEDAIGEILENY